VQLLVVSTCLVLCVLVALSNAGCGTINGADGVKYDLDPLSKYVLYLPFLYSFVPILLIGVPIILEKRKQPPTLIITIIVK
jgi:hypothetical protein